MKIKPYSLAIVSLLLLVQSVAAKNNAAEANIMNPLDIIESATEQMIEQLELNKECIISSPSLIMGIVEELLLPLFATNTISRKVLGKHARTISDEDKKRFSTAFRFYMVRFYSKVFAEYTNQTFKYLPAPDYLDKKRITIKSQLLQQGANPVSIDYQMQRSGNSWKIIDLKIEGISMVLSNKKQFGKQISEDGIATVIAKLEYKNNKALSDE